MTILVLTSCDNHKHQREDRRLSKISFIKGPIQINISDYGNNILGYSFTPEELKQYLPSNRSIEIIILKTPTAFDMSNIDKLIKELKSYDYNNIKVQ